MDYPTIEQEALDLMEKTNFKNISKDNVLTIVNKLSELRPDVAKDIISQFPEFSLVAREVIKDYKGILDGVIESDDKSEGEYFDVLNKESEGVSDSRREYYAMANKVRDDISKCLEDENLTAEQRNTIIAQEMELLDKVSEKDKELGEKEREISKDAYDKDTEKRKFNWQLIAAGSTLVLSVVAVGVTTLTGGKIDLKLPKKS